MTGLNHLEWYHPWWLLALLLLLPLYYFLFIKKQGNPPAMFISEIYPETPGDNFRTRLAGLLPVLPLISLLLLIIAMARPRLALTEETVKADGIDIMLVMDLSSSMLAKDFNPDRLEVSKMVAKEFVEKRPYDRIGLVVFSGESFTQCPLTTDHNILKDFLSSLQTGLLQDGTAIGMGLATAVNRIKDSDAKSRIIILLTDGVNNAGYIQPMTAAEIAASYGVKVYTIGVGTMGQAVSPIGRRPDGQYVFGLSAVEIDTELLQQISDMTGGRYYRSTDRKSLEQIYDEIDRLEKTEIEVTAFRRYSELYRYFLWAGVSVWLIYILLDRSVLRSMG